MMLTNLEQHSNCIYIIQNCDYLASEHFESVIFDFFPEFAYSA